MFFSSHNHSHYSNFRLLDAINRPEHLFDRAIEIGLTGFAITDHESLSAHVGIMKLRDEMKKSGKLPEDFTVGFGNEAYLVDEIDLGIKYFHWLVIAKDRKGHDILRKLSSQAWDNAYTDRGMQRVPITKQQVKDIMERENGKGHLIVTSACLGGELGSHALAIKGLEETGLVTEDPLLNHIVDKYMGEWQSFKDIDINELINYHKQEMVEYVNWNIEVFGKENFFIELAPNSNEQVYANEMLYNLAKAYDLKPIFATDSHYLTKDDQAIHRAFLNSKDGEREVDDFYSTAYMMDIDEVWEYMQISFTREQFIEMRNNLEYMRSMIEEYSLFREQEIPRVEVQVPEIMHPQITDREKYPHMYTLLGSDHDQDLFWIRTCLNELYKRGKWNEKYLETLENEAEVIVKVSERLGQDMSAYYNTAKRLIEIMWDKGNSLVGASRGSAMAFLSNWLLDITQIDPIPYEIPYWRHLSANRPELPDVDIDTEGFKRDQILEAMKEEFGYDRVLNICTYGTEGTKSAILTAARGLDIENDIGLYLTGMVPQERGFDWSLHDMVEGNKAKGRRPIAKFVEEIQKYPGWLETAYSIEGLVTKRGSHAAGVYFFNDDYTSMNAMMKTPAGLPVTQWDMNESDMLGGLKFDFLSVEALDKIRACMDLLIEDKEMEEKESLKETYETYIGPETSLQYDKDFWLDSWEGKVIDLFQFQTPVGGEAIKKGKPSTVVEAAALNSLMRLMPMDDGVVPTDKFVKFKENLDLWYEEMKNAHVPQEEVAVLERHYLQSYGVPNTQEELMLILMDTDICGFSETEANWARKVVGKKIMSDIPKLRAMVFEKAVCSNETINYIWNTAISVQLGYSFSLPHTIAYTIIALQELNLYKRFHSIYWNTACLIVNSGDEGESTDYAKIATAIGNLQSHGVNVDLVDINLSTLNFKPDPENNRIIYGLKALVGVGDATISDIIKNRPYVGMDDFIERVQPTKVPLISLIKSNAFGSTEPHSRQFLMLKGLKYFLGSRKTLTLANIPLLKEMDLIPEEYDEYYRLYEFNRYLKSTTKSKTTYTLDPRAQDFYIDNDFEEMFLETTNSNNMTILAKRWDSQYDKAIQPLRDWLKEMKEDLLAVVSIEEALQEFKKYGGAGNLGRWEMDSVCFYHSEHELIGVNKEQYGIKTFKDMSREAPVKSTFMAFGREIPLFHLSSIVGTVLAKDKSKGSISLLTPEGDVVLVKMNKEKFSWYDRQISVDSGGGKKEVLERSWFGRGNLLMVTGYRRGDQFIPKVYKDTPKEELYLITEVGESGDIVLKSQRG